MFKWDMYKLSLKSNFLAELKVHCQSNLIVSTNSETKIFKNITLKNKTWSNRGWSTATAKSKMEVLATSVISKKLLTKGGNSSITDVAGLLDTLSKLKLTKNVSLNIAKQKIVQSEKAWF